LGEAPLAAMVCAVSESEPPRERTHVLHPDRRCATLANRPASAPVDLVAPPPGSSDSRVDLKLLTWRARRALANGATPAARARFAAVDAPHLLAGTVQDGTARGVQLALEETIDLCAWQEPPLAETCAIDGDAEVFEGKALRKKKDILVASGGSRIRWSRKGGVIVVDREHGVHAEDCIRFEDRHDRGDLDGFDGDPDERPRIFSPAFLQPLRLVQGKTLHRLDLVGRLGRRGDGHACSLTFLGRSDEPCVRMIVSIDHRLENHRLRVRFLGASTVDAIDADGTPGFTVVQSGARVFVAATLVRAVGSLELGSERIPTPAAQCKGVIRHEFRLGGKPWGQATQPTEAASKDR
jgi:hypothetical protein